MRKRKKASNTLLAKSRKNQGVQSKQLKFHNIEFLYSIQKYTKSCYHCKKSHETWSRQCPMWKLEKQIIEEKTKNNITFKDARIRIYSSNQDLVSQVPKLNRYLQNKTTYSNISAQPDVITSLQETIKQLKDQNKALQIQVSELITLITIEKQNKLDWCVLFY